MKPLDERDVAFAATLSKSDIPSKLRCPSCNGLALNSMKLLCCDQSLCGMCYLELEHSCQAHRHSPPSCELHKVDKQLRTLTLAFVKVMRISSDAEAGRESSDHLKRTRSQARAQRLLMRFEVALFQPFRFSSLPVELQDIILDFAYPQQPNTRYTNLSQWQRIERDRRRADPTTYQVLSFPKVKVAEFLVSKAYFAAAARIWTTNQFFQPSQGVAYYVLGWGGYSDFGGIVSAYVTNPRTKLGPQQRFHLFAHLKHLELTIEASNFNLDSFEASNPKFVWVDELDEKELVQTMQTVGLYQLAGLRVLKLIAGSCRWAKLASEVQMWQANVQRLEEVVKRTALRPKATLTQHSERTDSLYPGSSVRFATHPIVPQSQEVLSTPCKKDCQTEVTVLGTEQKQTRIRKPETATDFCTQFTLMALAWKEKQRGEDVQRTAESSLITLHVQGQQVPVEIKRELPIHSRMLKGKDASADIGFAKQVNKRNRRQIEPVQQPEVRSYVPPAERGFAKKVKRTVNRKTMK